MSSQYKRTIPGLIALILVQNAQELVHVNDRNLLLMHSYQEHKSPRESHPSDRRREPQAGAGQENGPALLRLGGQYPITGNYVKQKMIIIQC